MMIPEGWETKDMGMNYSSLVKFSATGDTGTIVFSNEKIPLSTPRVFLPFYRVL